MVMRYYWGFAPGHLHTHGTFANTQRAPPVPVDIDETQAIELDSELEDHQLANEHGCTEEFGNEGDLSNMSHGTGGGNNDDEGDDDNDGHDDNDDNNYDNDNDNYNDNEDDDDWDDVSDSERHEMYGDY